MSNYINISVSLSIYPVKLKLTAISEIRGLCIRLTTKHLRRRLAQFNDSIVPVLGNSKSATSSPYWEADLHVSWAMRRACMKRDPMSRSIEISLPKKKFIGEIKSWYLLINNDCAALIIQNRVDIQTNKFARRVLTNIVCAVGEHCVDFDRVVRF